MTTKAFDVVVGGVSHIFHQFGRICRRKPPARSERNHVAFNLPPAFHLRHDQTAKIAREWIEIDAVGDVLHIAEAVGIGARQNLFDHGNRLVEIVGRSDCFRDLLAIFRLVGEGGRIDERLEQCDICVRTLGDELLRCREGAARMPVPDFYSMCMKPTPSDGALIDRIGRKESSILSARRLATISGGGPARIWIS